MDASASATAPLARSAFDLDPALVYLNHAAIGVLPTASRDALIDYAAHHARRGVLGTARFEAKLPASRARLARFLGASANEIAFLSNTSEAANILARGIVWKPGDEVLTNDNEFGSNALPWLALADEGVRVRLIATARERMTPDVLRREITDRTRVVTVSWVSFTDGYRHDLAALAEIAHAHGALFTVDAIQGLGAFPFDMHAMGVDAVYGGAQKWLLGEPGLGYLAVRASLVEELRLRLPGWRSVEDIWNFLDYAQPPAPGAVRFEAGSPNLMGIAALDASLDVLDSVPAAERAAHILALTDYLVDGLRTRGATIKTLRGDGISSGIVTFETPGVDPLETGRRLADAGIVVTSRTTGVRVSPHAYNTRAEIDALLDAIA